MLAVALHQHQQHQVHLKDSWFDVSCQAKEVSRSGCGTLSDLQLAMTGAIAAKRIGVN
jgi:hypothetical protein